MGESHYGSPAPVSLHKLERNFESPAAIKLIDKRGKTAVNCRTRIVNVTIMYFQFFL